MKVCGIICEFNPLHNGHQYLLDRVRQEGGADAVVCVMSGDFVQRGYPALQDKHQRAKAAVLCGADLVLELPVYYAVNGASEFARGGVRILHGLGCIDMLAFGMESQNAAALQQLADLLSQKQPEFEQALKEPLSRWLSYPTALSAAGRTRVIPIPASPNDILALEYIRSSMKEGAEWSYFGVERKGAGHNEDTPVNGFASASYLRNGLKNGRLPDAALTALMPPASLTILKESPLFDQPCEDRYYQILRSLLLSEDPARLALALEMGEGLEHRFKAALQTCDSLDGLIHAVKTKRDTYGRISRILAQLALGLKKETYRKAVCENHTYANMLAFNETGAGLLAACKKEGTLPIVSNVKKVPEDVPYKALLDSDCRASDLYSVLTDRPIGPHSDRSRIPVLMKNSRGGR